MLPLSRQPSDCSPCWGVGNVCDYAEDEQTSQDGDFYSLSADGISLDGSEHLLTQSRTTCPCERDWGPRAPGPGPKDYL